MNKDMKIYDIIFYKPFSKQKIKSYLKKFKIKNAKIIDEDTAYIVGLTRKNKNHKYQLRNTIFKHIQFIVKYYK